MVRTPGLEPKSSSKEPFLLLKEISKQCLEDIRKGKTGTVKQLLSLLSGVNNEYRFGKIFLGKTYRILLTIKF